MKIIIQGSSKEIADLISKIQGQQQSELSSLTQEMKKFIDLLLDEDTFEAIYH